MPSNTTAALRDMQHNIDMATQFVAGMDYEAFRDDARTAYAVNPVPGNHIGGVPPSAG
ncbi:MAG TPA: hypothetical protein VMQ86_11455 [Bryobacteraceae bacterium]|jgi:uncharacterized protein with HEPN domain|nr:hypothetical protein [Bryobacteraceae bacterium]